jgi:hypothetical protein
VVNCPVIRLHQLDESLRVWCRHDLGDEKVRRWGDWGLWLRWDVVWEEWKEEKVVQVIIVWRLEKRKATQVGFLEREDEGEVPQVEVVKGRSTKLREEGRRKLDSNGVLCTWQVKKGRRRGGCSGTCVKEKRRKSCN